jgi:hypothetical protein
MNAELNLKNEPPPQTKEPDEAFQKLEKGIESVNRNALIINTITNQQVHVAWEEGFDYGKTVGERNGKKTGYTKGFHEGFVQGYREGTQKSSQQAEVRVQQVEVRVQAPSPNPPISQLTSVTLRNASTVSLDLSQPINTQINESNAKNLVKGLHRSSVICTLASTVAAGFARARHFSGYEILTWLSSHGFNDWQIVDYEYRGKFLKRLESPTLTRYLDWAEDLTNCINRAYENKYKHGSRQINICMAWVWDFFFGKEAAQNPRESFERWLDQLTLNHMAHVVEIIHQYVASRPEWKKSDNSKLDRPTAKAISTALWDLYRLSGVSRQIYKSQVKTTMSVAQVPVNQ